MTMLMFSFTFAVVQIGSRGVKLIFDMFRCFRVELILFVELILLEARICSFCLLKLIHFYINISKH